MKGFSILVLQGMVVLLGLFALAFMLYEPHLEGRNINSTLFEVYFNDPFLAGAYAASTLFFISLYQAFKLLGYKGKDTLISFGSVKSLQIIRYSTTALVLLLIAAEAYLFVFVREQDDIAGGVAMGLFMILIFALVTISALTFEKRIQNQL